YRYDGLYKVERWWEETGLAGYKVYKYAFKRLPDQPPLGTCVRSFSESEEEGENSADEKTGELSCSKVMKTDEEAGEPSCSKVTKMDEEAGEPSCSKIMKMGEEIVD
ncbi:9695_t:CDS:1, partial [Acaulospora colombiana]